MDNLTLEDIETIAPIEELDPLEEEEEKAMSDEDMGEEHALYDKNLFATELNQEDNDVEFE